jgi:hypothetical protein
MSGPCSSRLGHGRIRKTPGFLQYRQVESCVDPIGPPRLCRRKPTRTRIWYWTTLEDDLAAPGGRPTEEDTGRETLIRNLMDDQYSHPARIVAFNTAEGWSRDVTMDIADELRITVDSTP